MVEPPYGIIWRQMRSGNVIPFLGAGASCAGRCQDATWDAKAPAFLPNGIELAHFLADEATFPSTNAADRDDLAKVASYYADISGRSTLRRSLREVLNRQYQAGALHEFLASVPAPQVIVVTNYDSLLEQAFQAAGKPYDLVIYAADRKDIANAILWWPHGEREPRVSAPNELDIDLSRTTVIYKMHGTLGRETPTWDNFVITEEDYVEFLSRMTTNTAVPALFYPYFRERSFLFLGYSLRDWNLRVVLKNLSKHLTSRRPMHPGDGDDLLPSWAILRSPSVLEQRLWEKRHVAIFDVELNDFVAKLRERRGG
jgi:hypothetical protein